VRDTLHGAQRRRDNSERMNASGSTPALAPCPRAGFTIIELMLVVAVAGVLALVAYPSFMDSIRKGRRAEAVAALAQVQQAQERWRSNKTSYADNAKLTVDPPNGLGLKASTSSGLYTLSIDLDPDKPDSIYTATATAVAGKSQSNDTHCTVMRIRLKNANFEYGGCAGCAVPEGALTDPDRCWSR
jgi:type IV pilus assembly protein PilE